MILDLILLAFVIILLVTGAKRGLAKTLFNVLSLIAAALCSYWISGFLARFAYNTFMANDVANSLSDATGQSAQAAGDIMGSLPGTVAGIMGIFGIDNNALINSAGGVANSAAEGAAAVTEGVIGSIVISILSFVLTIVLFFVFLFVFRRISKHLCKVFRIPVIKQLNGILGGCLGLIEGLLFAYLVVIVFGICMLIVKDFFVTEELINQSYIFKSLYNTSVVEMVTESMRAFT